MLAGGDAMAAEQCLHSAGSMRFAQTSTQRLALISPAEECRDAMTRSQPPSRKVCVLASEMTVVQNQAICSRSCREVMTRWWEQMRGSTTNAAVPVGPQQRLTRQATRGTRTRSTQSLCSLHERPAEGRARESRAEGKKRRARAPGAPRQTTKQPAEQLINGGRPKATTRNAAI